MKPPEKERPTEWQAVTESFLQSLRVRRYSPETIKSRMSALDTFFYWLETKSAVHDLREVDQEILRNFQYWMQTEQPWKTSTVHVKLIGLRRFFEHLETCEIILFNPCEGLVLPKLETRLPQKIFTKEEVQTFLDAPDTNTPRGIRDKAILEMLYSTGLRRAEIVGLRVSDVDVPEGFVRVNCGKGAKDRVVPLGKVAAVYLEKYLKEVRSQWAEGYPEVSALWLSSITPHDRPFSKHAIYKMLEGYGKKVGIQVGCHVWRHTCATHMLQGGASIAHVQQLLGHSCLESTQLYTRTGSVDVKTMHRHKHPRALSRQSAKDWKPHGRASIRGRYQLEPTNPQG